MENTTPQWAESFWKMLADNRFVNSVNSVTTREEKLVGGVEDMEAIVKINGEFDKYAIEEFISDLITNKRDTNN